MKNISALLFGSVILAGCGSDDGSSAQRVDPRPQSAVIEGIIDNVDVNNHQVTMNGRAYHITKVTFSDEQAIQLADLKPNMMVRLSTESNDKAKNTLNAELALEPTMVGILSYVNRNTGDFTINGTTFSADKALLADVEKGDWVMVSSLPTANAGYHVLSIVKFEPADPSYVEMEGMVNHLEKDQFTLGATLTVKYTNAVIEDNAFLSNGQWVEVMGLMEGSIFHASEIEVEEYEGFEENTDIEGIITWVENDKSSFELNYKGRFMVTTKTIYDDGNKDQLTLGKHVEVTAKVVNGENQAMEIEFEGSESDEWEDHDDIEFSGVITSTHFTTESPYFVMRSGLVEKTMFVTSRTEFDDYLTLQDIFIGMRVDVEAQYVNGQYIALEIEQDDND